MSGRITVNGLTYMSYSDRLGHLSIESLQLRRLRHDLIILYKLIHGCLDISASDFLTMSHLVTTRGHKFKLSVQYSSVIIIIISPVRPRHRDDRAENRSYRSVL